MRSAWNSHLSRHCVAALVLLLAGAFTAEASASEDDAEFGYGPSFQESWTIEPFQLANRRVKLGWQHLIGETERFSWDLQLAGSKSDQPTFGETLSISIEAQFRVNLLGDFGNNVHIASSLSLTHAQSTEADKDEPDINRDWSYGILVGEKMTWDNGFMTVLQLGAMKTTHWVLAPEKPTSGGWAMAARWAVGYAY